MAQITVDLPPNLLRTLAAAATTSRRSADLIVARALARHLGEPDHTIFQVSTAGALVAGVFDREVDVATLLAHGDFGLGTFEKLDGEMVVLEGKAYQALGSGEVREAPGEAGAPFAVVTRFRPEAEATLPAVSSFAGLERACDAHRHSANVFHALRIDGRFDRISTRSVCAMPHGSTLTDAAKAQHEFHFEHVDGTLVGIWSPGFTSALSVAGYHFHFLSDDRSCSGHVLDVAARALRLRVEVLNDFHLILPDSASFRDADLSQDPAEALASAEQAH